MSNLLKNWLKAGALAIACCLIWQESQAQLLTPEPTAPQEVDSGPIKTMNVEGSVQGDALGVDPFLYEKLRDYAIYKPNLRIDRYLIDQGVSEQLVSRFLLDFFDGVPAFLLNEEQGSFRGTQPPSDPEECECGVLYPNVIRDRSTYFIRTYTFQPMWFFPFHFSYDVGMDGPAKLNYMVQERARHKKTSRTRELYNAYARLEFLNLCIGGTKGIPVPADAPCSCDKLVDFTGHYTTRGKLNGTLKGWPFSRGIWANLEDVISVFANDLTLNTMGYAEATNYWHFKTDGVRKTWRERTGYRTGLLASAVNLAGTIVLAATTGNFDQNSLNSLVSDIQNFVPTHSTTGSQGDVTKYVNWNTFFILKANVPKEVYMSSATKIAAGGYGPNYKAYSSVSSDLDYGFLINETRSAGFIDGQPNGEDDACCSEGYAGWYYTQNFTGLRDPAVDVVPTLKGFLNQYNNNWQTSFGATTSNGKVTDLYYRAGKIKSTGFCAEENPCEHMMNPDGPNGPELVVPHITFDPVQPNGIYCLGDPFDVILTNFGVASSLGIPVTWYLNGAHVDDNTDVITISEPGAYTITYGEEDDPCAQSISFYIPECTAWDSTTVVGDSLYEEEYDSTGVPDEGKSALILGAEEDTDQARILLYPNPVQDQLRITDEGFFGRNGTVQYTITSMDGRIVKQGILDGTTTHVDCRKLVSGMYVLQVHEGELLRNRTKFFKE